jgi:hypothetical protein
MEPSCLEVDVTTLEAIEAFKMVMDIETKQ